jgi:hypothetical protein
MSHGPGRVQRAIAELITANPDGAWTTALLCKHIYGECQKKHRVAVARALAHMQLPKPWNLRVGPRTASKRYLVNPCSAESVARLSWLDCDSSGHQADFERWKGERPDLVEQAREQAKYAQRYRSASPAKKIRMARRKSVLLRVFRQHLKAAIGRRVPP